MVPAEPAADFTARCAAAVAAAAAEGRPFDVVYVSQVTYLSQRTLVPSIPVLARAVRAAGDADSASASDGSAAPLLVVDACHGFAALPTELAGAEGEVVYVASLLKHAGCGANCAFLTLPARLAATLRPVFTGWLADPSVLAPGSAGVAIGSAVGWCPELALQGGTPAFMQPLLTFNHLMRLWAAASPAITVGGLHCHVMRLHAAFLENLDAAGHATVNCRTLLAPQDEACRSHTLCFEQPDAAAAKATVDALAAHGVLLDSRKRCVRVGFGANHSSDDVAALLAALKAVAGA